MAALMASGSACGSALMSGPRQGGAAGPATPPSPASAVEPRVARCAGPLCGIPSSGPSPLVGLGCLCLLCGGGLEGVQLLGLLGRDQPDLDEVERADEAVAEAEAAGAGDRVAQR